MLPYRTQVSSMSSINIIIFHLSKLWKAKFFILCGAIFLVRLRGKFEIDHSWEWKGQLTNGNIEWVLGWKGRGSKGLKYYEQHSLATFSAKRLLACLPCSCTHCHCVKPTSISSSMLTTAWKWRNDAVRQVSRKPCSYYGTWKTRQWTHTTQQPYLLLYRGLPAALPPTGRRRAGLCSAQRFLFCPCRTELSACVVASVWQFPA